MKTFWQTAEEILGSIQVSIQDGLQAAEERDTSPTTEILKNLWEWAKK